MNVTAIVLAAGTSSRMGQQNKLLLEWQDSTILETVLQNILASNASTVIVVTGHEHEQIEQQVKGMELQMVHNRSFPKGMTSTIQAGVRQVPLNQGVLICPGDMPLLTPSDYNFLIPSSARKCIIVPEFNGQRGNPVYFSAHFREQLLAHTEPEGCKGVVMANEQYVKVIEGSQRNVCDIDSPEDL